MAHNDRTLAGEASAPPVAGKTATNESDATLKQDTNEAAVNDPSDSTVSLDNDQGTPQVPQPTEQADCGATIALDGDGASSAAPVTGDTVALSNQANDPDLTENITDLAATVALAESTPKTQSREPRSSDPTIADFGRGGHTRDRHGPADHTVAEVSDSVRLQKTVEVGQRTLADMPEIPATGRPRRREKQPLPARVAGYDILGELGRGGMGVVYKARQPGANRVVALKMVLASGHVDAETLARFQLEAEAVAGLQHPNIVQLYEVGEEGGCPFFSLEYIDGDSLGKKIDGVPQPPKDSARLVQCLAEAMHLAHQRGIIHRDLKPANILLTQDGVPKITDFGLAKRFEDKGEGQTRTGAIMGTPSYMAPEQAQGKTKNTGPAADIYSLGAILYDLITGRPPFRGTTLLETLQQVQNMEPLPPIRLQPSLPHDLQTICLKALEKDPAKRFTTAGELAEDLRRYLAGEPILARPTPLYERAWKWARRRPAVAALLSVCVVGVLAVLVLGGLYLDSERRAAEDREMQQKELAQLEAKEAESQRERAEKEKELHDDAVRNFLRAEKNYQRAKGAVDEMLSQVGQDRLAHIPQMQEIRRELLLKALKFYEEFSEEQQSDQSLQRELARAQQRVADIRERLGEHRLAEKAYRKALELLARLDSTLPELQADRADTSNQFANLLKDLKRNSDAEKFYGEALAIRQNLYDTDSQNPAYAFNLARAQLNLGMISHLLGKTGAAETGYHAGRKHLVALADKNPSNLRFGEELAVSFDLVGNLQRELGRSKEAEESLLDANRRLLHLAKEVPGNVDYRYSLGLNHHHLGDLYRDSNAKAAEEQYKAAIAIRADLVEKFAQVPVYRQDLAATYANLAILYQAASRQKEADAAYEEALNIQIKAANDFPLLPDNRRRLASTYINRGNMLLGTNRLQQGEADFLKAHDLLEPLSKKFPDVPEYQAELATALLNLGTAAFSSNRIPEGKTFFESALAVREKLASRYPDAPVHQQKLGDTLLNCATLMQIMQRPEEAEKIYQRAVGIFSELQKTDARNPDYPRMLALTLNNLGNLQQQANKPGDAEKSWRRAVDLFRQLVNDFPDNHDFQQELGRHLNDLGTSYIREDRLQEAEIVLNEAVAFFKNLFERFPENLNHRRDLAIGHDSLGGLRNKQNKAEDAVAAFRTAVNLLEAPELKPAMTWEVRQQLIRSHSNLVNVLESLKRPAEAEKSWLRILDEREKLVQSFPKDQLQRAAAVEVLCALGNRTLTNAKFAEARDFYGRAVTHLHSLVQQNAKAYANSLYATRLNLAQAHLGEKDHAAAAKLVEQSVTMENIAPRQDHVAATVLARCAGLVDKTSPLRKTYGDQAMRLLEKAVQAGFRDLGSVMAEDWQALRNRDDYRAVLEILSPKK
ncbi:MAG: protein kinase [Planctomycetes bacterium]|nr:protein kinase [Planctomycetota bacterium]